MEPNEIRNIVDWDARSRAASRALTNELKSEDLDVERALELIDILARLALDFAGDDQQPRASRIRTRCDRTLRTLEVQAKREFAERIALMRLRVTRETRSTDELRERVAGLRRGALGDWSDAATAVLDAFDAHCRWEHRAHMPSEHLARANARAAMSDATTRLAEHYARAPEQWLADYAWACGRLAYWFDMAGLREEELLWRRRTVDALRHQLESTQAQRGLLGIHEEKLGRLLTERGEFDEAREALESALVHVSDWDEITRSVRAALKKLRKQIRKQQDLT